MLATLAALLGLLALGLIMLAAAWLLSWFLAGFTLRHRYRNLPHDTGTGVSDPYVISVLHGERNR